MKSSERDCAEPLIVKCSGGAFELGRSHGRLLQQAVRFNVANFWKACSAAGTDRRTVLASARLLAQDYRDWVLEEIRGIAAGAGANAQELLAYNLCRGAVFSDECTVLFAMGDATASGNVLFLKNSDKIGASSMTGPGFYQNKEINVVVV